MWMTSAGIRDKSITVTKPSEELLAQIYSLSQTQLLLSVVLALEAIQGLRP
jgi:hypothetical protein